MAEDYSVFLDRNKIVNDVFPELSANTQSYTVGTMRRPFSLQQESFHSVWVFRQTGERTKQVAVSQLSLVNVRVVDSILDHLYVRVAVGNSFPSQLMHELPIKLNKD
jgi:hypothetical protein